MKEIIILDVPFVFKGVEQTINDTIHPVVLKDDKNVVLVDCGYVGSLDAIEQELCKNGIMPESVTHIVITHQDHDHMGAAYAMKLKYPQVKIVAHIKEAPFITGEQKSLRLIQAENMQEYLPEEQKSFGEIFCNVLKSVVPVNVDILVDDNETFDWCGGCTIIATPGHTPGHISLLVNDENIIIAGDAATINEGQLVTVNPQFALNLDEANRSLDLIKNMKPNKVICYHGGVYN